MGEFLPAEASVSRIQLLSCLLAAVFTEKSWVWARVAWIKAKNRREEYMIGVMYKSNIKYCIYNWVSSSFYNELVI